MVEFVENEFYKNFPFRTNVQLQGCSVNVQPQDSELSVYRVTVGYVGVLLLVHRSLNGVSPKLMRMNLLLVYGSQGNSSEYVGGFMRMNLILVYGFQGNSSEYVGGTLPHGFLNAKECFPEVYENESYFGLWFPRK
ncbi:hypothetical protein CEXT_39501 [Caerostris extrusa]|uniref:Uncharacterized protein n=1 Tax=Caerostris extrusa TaxID=172846 RepID=A0AAV4PDD3_CAEEX|nr:hypothetical protein CEXT_39501 [Caerostris extrusa]